MFFLLFNVFSYLEPVKDVLLAHVSEHALVYKGTVASDITLKFFVITPDILKESGAIHFLAPTGAQGEGMLCVRPCVCDIIQNNIENEL